MLVIFWTLFYSIDRFVYLCANTILSWLICLVKAMVFPVVMYGCESWTIKKAERQRIDAFELWCWRRLLRVPWTARRSNQSILKEISPECSLEGLMLTLELQHFGHLMRRADSFEKTLMLGMIEGGRRRGQQKMEDSLLLTCIYRLQASLGVSWVPKKYFSEMPFSDWNYDPCKGIMVPRHLVALKMVIDARK